MDEIKFKYDVGVDCWVVSTIYKPSILFRGTISSRILREDVLGKHIEYEVKLQDSSQVLTLIPESSIFDVATRAHDAICALYKIVNK